MARHIHIHVKDHRYRKQIPSVVIERAKEILDDDEAEEVRKILTDPWLQDIMYHPKRIHRGCDVPYLAGSNIKGGTTYIDRRLPSIIEINGKYVDPARYLNVHEQVERALMEGMNLSYKKAHKIAERYERFVVESDGLDWVQYEKIMDGYIDETEHEKVEKAPHDLYLKPYDKVLKNRMKRHEELTGVDDGKP